MLPGAEASTCYTAFNQLGIGATPAAWSQSISGTTLTFVNAVPEPTTLAAVAAGAVGLLGRRRRRA